MKFPFFALLICLAACSAPEPDPDFVADDVLNYWTAYDLVTATTDSAEQADILEREFFAKGTPGLAAIMEQRNYTKEEYRQNINNMPKFWASMRQSMLRAPELAGQVAAGAEDLFKLYPQQLPGRVYFTVGAFRTNGLTVDSLVLFGTEMAMAGPDVDLSEWPARGAGQLPYMQSNPVENLKFLATHEFTHTQQPVRTGYNLLSQCLLEGTAEFVAATALGEPSTTPAIAFGEANDEAVKAAFASAVNAPWWYHWLYNDTDNEFKTRDLGYYVGYALAKRYYDATDDKKAAIKTLIELDYGNRYTVESFVDALGYFDRPVAELNVAYEAKRPVVTGITEFNNQSRDVDPATDLITINFDRPVSNYFKSTDLGPLGKDHVPNIRGIKTAADGMSVTYGVELIPGLTYQMVIDQGYRTNDDVPIVPYLVEFTTR